MDVQALHQFVASLPGTFGQLISRRMMVNRMVAGRVDAAATLVGLAGLDTIPVLIGAGAPPPMVQAAVGYAVFYRYHELRGVDRAAFAAWCRQAAFTAPRPLPEMVEIYRGTMGCSPAEAAAGLHWSLGFEDAAYYAARFADADLTGCIVLRTRVPRDEIVAFIGGSANQEVIPAAVPTTFEVITDHQRIGDAALRCALRLQALKAKGWAETGSEGIAEEAAMATRARMAATGVPRGTAIVA
ncbi:hypothetical protein [Methylorubrum extorquens]|uniref:Uncharacterized protein n=1 Tax=Methylorubrum extorquens DSM 13060 TaxID=882800 RepID=H1KE89_METEX|nr:hypothetical protein [Methylorubrum extorquens]EHP94206.1 hypothetical protein MetexDRAFT_0951 [Methylorubrum extorquens DSM 13060]